MKSFYILKAFSTISNRVPLATPAADYTLQNKISISGVSGVALCHRAVLPETASRFQRVVKNHFLLQVVFGVDERGSFFKMMNLNSRFSLIH